MVSVAGRVVRELAAVLVPVPAVFAALTAAVGLFSGSRQLGLLLPLLVAGPFGSGLLGILLDFGVTVRRPGSARDSLVLTAADGAVLALLPPLLAVWPGEALGIVALFVSTAGLLCIRCGQLLAHSSISRQNRYVIVGLTAIIAISSILWLAFWLVRSPMSIELLPASFGSSPFKQASCPPKLKSGDSL